MKFAIAAVSFLNTIPLIDFLRSLADDQVGLCLDLPSRLAGYLSDGSADVALLPVAEILRGETGGILPAGAIACHGPVNSVKVFATSELTALQRISADRGSRSSVALLRVLLSEIHGLSLPVSEIKPQTDVMPAEGEGVLIIGDRCFEYEKFLRESGHDEVKSWDLGQLWWELTGLPFVFAIWAVAPGFPLQAGLAAVAELKGLLSESLAHGLRNLSNIAAREAVAGRLGHEGYATKAAIDYYFRRSLCFTVGEQELAGIRRFHQLAVAREIIPERPLPPVL